MLKYVHVYELAKRHSIGRSKQRQRRESSTKAKKWDIRRNGGASGTKGVCSTVQRQCERERKRDEASDRKPEMRENGHYSDSVGHHRGPPSGMATAE
jgi:hypothetical protein